VVDLRPVQKTRHAIEVRVDPRVELISVIQYTSRYRETFPFLLNADPFPYREAVTSYFASYADHSVVKRFDEISSQPRMFNFMAPPTTMLYLRNDLTLRDDVVWPEAVLQRAGGRESLEEFAAHLRGFCEATAFAGFYVAHAAYYERLVAAVIAKLGAKDYVRELEAFYGVHHSSYTLILVSLYGHVGFGPYLDTLPGERQIYNILGPQGILTEKHWDQAKAYAHLYDALPRQEVCGEWNECVNEYIIRAVTTYLAFQDSETAGQAALEAERARNVVLIDDLLARIREYAAHREQYPTFDDYYPHLLETFAGH
jgi:hypothetical protein